MHIRHHFQKHGAVHATWTISILILVIVILVFRSPDSDRLGTIIGFAASAVSLVLALIAIGYSFISNQSFSEMVGSLRASVDRADTSSRTVSEASATLATVAERVAGEVADLRPRFDAIDSKIDQRLSPDRLIEAPPRPTNTSSQLPDRGSTLAPALAISLYVLARMDETSKNFDPRTVFVKESWKQYVAGCLTTISYLKPLGIDLRRPEIFTYSLKSLGDITREGLLQYIDINTLNTKYKTYVDSYFDEEASDGQVLDTKG
jgi:hypothetical protein